MYGTKGAVSLMYDLTFSVLRQTKMLICFAAQYFTQKSCDKILAAALLNANRRFAS